MILDRVLATIATTLVETRSLAGQDLGGSSSAAAEARHLAGMLEPMQGRLAAIAEDIGILRDQVGGLALSQGRARQLPKTRREGRKRGLAAFMGRLFWDRMMQHFVEAIRKEGPKTAVELLATLDADALQMAEAALERMDPSPISEKVDELVKRGNYFERTENGRYDVL